MVIINHQQTTSRLRLGTCYYPEQWSENLWSDDFQRMQAMGFSLVRVAEFAWTIFEPHEGQFSFDLFDRVLNEAHRHHLDVILGTPTATPPAWLTHKYPEVLNVRQDGVPYRHGQRRHYNYNSKVYHVLAGRIVEELAMHYRHHPAVIGWQIDNEINCEVNVFYSEADDLAFQRWLRDRYKTLEALNQAWGTVFWNQTYSAWDEVHLTRVTVSDSPNPHQLLDEKRFISASAMEFVQLQADVIRRVAPNHFITTNGLFGHVDSHQMTKNALDWLSYDSYPNFATLWSASNHDLRDRQWSKNLSVVRDISPHFWVMEQQAGAGGWVNRMEAPSPKPGQLRLWTYQSVAHGAEAVLYFRWRTAVFGTEIYWHGLNDYHNQPNRRLAEATQVGEEFERIGDLLVGTAYQTEVALVRDYDNEWDGEFDRWVGPLQTESEQAWNISLQYRHIPFDITYIRHDTTLEHLLRYRLLVYPHPAILSDTTATLLATYVEHGGHLVFGCRSGYKDAMGHCYMRPFPGALAELAGIQVDDFTLIGKTESPPKVLWEKAGIAATTADRFNEVLHPQRDDVEVLARYAETYYAGKPALTRRPYGQGVIYYYGATFNPSVVDQMLTLVGITSPADGILDLPKNIELAIRRSPSGANFWFLLNFASTPETVEMTTSFFDLLSSRVITGTWELEAHGVAVLTEHSE